jgi:hypothetical protein
MGADLNEVGLLTRREIEARIAGPLINAFAGELGKGRTLEIVKEVIISLARESGEMLRAFVGGDSLEDFAKGMSLWSRDDAVQYEIIELTPEKIAMNVTQCRYAEMYRELGIEELGFTLSCTRDFALVEGFNPRIKLERSQTIMEGAEHCDFRFTLEKG